MRCQYQPCLFGMRNTGGGTTVPAAGALPHLDKDQRCIGLHDEIDFTATATVIALDQQHAIAKQISQRVIFGDTPARSGWLGTGEMTRHQRTTGTTMPS